MVDALSRPWPWYVAGPLIGLVVPALLLMGGRSFGVSSNLRHLCAALVPGRSEFLRYDWRGSGGWNLLFALGILAGGVIAGTVLRDPGAIRLADTFGLTPDGLLPRELFDWSALATPGGVLALVVRGFLVGFGASWAGGCTSGHAITGLANVELPSLLAVCGFFAGGLIATHLIWPGVRGAVRALYGTEGTVDPQGRVRAQVYEIANRGNIPVGAREVRPNVCQWEGDPGHIVQIDRNRGRVETFTRLETEAGVILRNGVGARGNSEPETYARLQAQANRDYNRLAEHYIREGLSPDDASRRAIRELDEEARRMIGAWAIAMSAGAGPGAREVPASLQTPSLETVETVGRPLAALLTPSPDEIADGARPPRED